MKSSKPPTTRRPPHPSLSGQRRPAHLLFETPLESWREEIGRGGIFSAEKLAALATVLMIVFSQLGLAAPAGASGAAATAVDDAYTIAEGSSLTAGGGVWHLPDWRLRRSFTFSNTGRGRLDNFPVLVKIDPADINYTRTQSLGEDLRFVDSDGTLLAYEIEEWNTGGSYVWVKVPQIDAGSATDYIWMYYDNGSVGDAQNPAAVWSNGYVGVWHMDQNPGTSQILDSTTYLNHGTANDMDPADLQPGQIGDGLYFDGSTGANADYIRVPSDGADELSISGASPQLTLEAWVKRTGTPPADWMMAIGRQLGTSWHDNYILGAQVGAPDIESMGTSDGVTVSQLDSSPAAIPFDEWRYLTGVRDGNNMFVYSNGTQVGTTTAVSPMVTDNNDVTLGAAENGTSTDVTESWRGFLDEIRISNVPRSADWVNAQHASMTDTFGAYGIEEEAGVLANDSDPESDPMTAVQVAGPLHAAAFGLNLDGSFNYTPVAGMSGTDSFTYVANDGTADSNVATVSITVTATGPNNPPDAVDDPSEATNQDVSVIIDVLGNDTDPDLDGLTVSAMTQGANGSVVNNGSNMTYTPNASWTGVDSFAYETSDSNGGFDSATVTVTVSPSSNGPPAAVPGGPYFTDEGQDLILDGSGSSDPDTDPLTYNWDIDNDGQYDDATGPTPTVAWLTLVGLGFDDDGGPFPVGLEVDDGNGNTDTATVNWTIANTPPSILVSGTGIVTAGSIYTVNLSATDPGDETVTEWTINWGDGSISTIPGNPASATHPYANPGEYNITAAVSDEDSLPNLPWHNDRMVVPGLFADEQLFRLEATSGTVFDNLAVGSGQRWAITAIIGPDGLAYVGDYTGDSIRRYNPVTGVDLGVWIAAGTGGLDGPAGMQFGPDGHLYVSSNFGDQILEFDTDGTSLGVFASGGGLDEPDDLTFGPDGHLYVTSFNTDQVLKYNGRDGDPMGVFASGSEMDQPSELTFGPDGKLYVTSVANDHVARYNADGTYDMIFAAAGATGLNEPRAAVFGPDGHLYVGGRNRVVRYDGSGGGLVDVYLPSGSINGPSQSAFVPADRVAVLPLLVNSTGDSPDNNLGDGVCHTGGVNSDGAPECTLRAAMEEANAFPGTDTINFDLPTTDPNHNSGLWTISPGSVFDQIIETVIIDGRTQSGWASTPVVEINGAGAGAGGDGFRIAADDVEIRGLAINRFLADGIEVGAGAANTVIAANHIGLDTTGLIGRGNNGSGIDLGAGSGPTRVGGTEIAHRNLISGNGGDGIAISNSNANTVLNNFIGTDITGTAPVGNGADGIAVGGTSASNLIGQVGDTNVLSGNANDGFENDATGVNNAVYYNIIGLGIDANTPVPNGRHGVVISDGANTTFVYQNLISGNTESGVVIDGNGNAATAANYVIGNWIGLNLVNQPRPNGSHGVHIFAGATGNFVGGTPAEYRNVISGNANNGILIAGAATSGNSVENNFIGTTIAGDAAVANGNNGIYIAGAPSNTIGGTTVNHRNVVSGNGNNGILLDGAAATLNTIQGNYFGLNADGDAAVPNADEGVDLSDAPSNTVGGAAPNARNVISGNGDVGVLLIGALTTGNTVSANYIGTSAVGDTAVPNGTGVSVLTAAAGNRIGGVGAEGNLIAHNTGDGVWVTDTAGADNAILGNSIYSNGGLGIDVNLDGVTANGTGAPLDYPVITAAAESAGTVTVDFDLDVPAGDYRIEFYNNMAADSPTGYGEGETFVAFYDVVGHLGGAASFSVPRAGAGWVVLTATATEDLGAGSFGSTSEFSAAVAVVRDALVVNSTGDDVDANPGDGVCSTGSLNTEGNPECTLRAAIEESDALAGADTVNFDIPTSDPEYTASPLAFTLNPVSPYEPITGPLTLDARTQTGWVGDPIIQLNGTLAAGATAGLVIEGNDNTIAGFIIHSFEDEGLEIDGSPGPADSNTLQNNWVGLDASGTVLGNTGNGILLTEAADGNLIGGTGLFDGNVIAGNSDRGISIRVNSVGNTVIGNSIYSNTQLGIDLEEDGVTGNDLVPGDPDSGSNDLLNYPEITSAFETAGTLAVDFDLDVPAGDYRIEFFVNTSAHPLGNGEGETLVATYDVVGHAAGSTSYSTSFAGSTGDILTATTTEDLGAGSFGSTSEFSTAVTATGADTTAPVISLVGANPQVIEVGAPYVELGATALDDVDGDITGSIVINASAVDTSVIGSYTVTYDVSDTAGNPATQVTRTVDVVDTTAPVLVLLGANPLTIEVGGSYTEPGATASDIYDGDLTGSIVINSSAVNTAVVGSYAVTYDVADSSGNPASGFRTVDVVDTTLPVITLTGANPQTLEVNSAYAELGASALDNYDGDISGSIVTNSSAVNMAAVGSYTVTYNVTDSQGNAAVQVTRTVDVVDTGLPVITRVGASPVTVEVGSAYADAGATAFDVGDGDLTGSIVTVNPVNPLTLGSYTVTYNVSDSQGNSAVEVTRTVNVVDTTAPVITLVGVSPVTVEVGSAYVDAGATATDIGDGDLTGSIVTVNPVDTAVVGSYTVTYNVTDSQANAAVEVTRTVNVVDTTSPVIALVGANPQTIEVGSPYVELGASAADAFYGDISGSIVIDSSAVNTAIVGSYTVTYNVTDTNGNPAVQVTRTVEVVDTTAPVITLVGVNPQVIEVGSAYSELGATAVDAGDGDLTGSIVIDTSAVNAAVVGSYAVTYNVTDSHANAAVEVTRTVSVVDTTLPVITLAGANPQVIEVGAGYSELGATAADNYDGDITGSIVVDSSAVTPATVGSYSVTYNVTDANGNAAVQVTRTVNVVDTTVPVITLVGANPQVIEVGSGYSELGATATDNYDGDITGSIVVDSSAVIPATVGSYLVTYNVTDANGNAAVPVTRTLNVVDATVPVITLAGANPQVIEVGAGYSELGATAADNYDGDITGSIVINASAVDTNVVASYLVTYNVSDANGNAAVQATRTVNVVDTTVPVITLAGANPQVIEVGSAYSELGATAADNYDGDITGSVVVDSSAVIPATVGSYLVTYNATDANGNAAVQATRTVNVVDTTVPVITLAGANPQVIEVGSGYSELGATATDNYDGDIAGSIVVDTSAVNTAAVGSYSVTYNVTDANGNAAVQVTRTVNVVDTTVPVITLVGANPQVIEVGAAYSELGATAADTYDGDITGSIVVDAASVNTAFVGSYSVTYNVTDSEGNSATEVTRTVNVVDTAGPVITLVGANPQVIEAGLGYTELGATALDTYDGDVTGSIVIDSTAVNASVVGSYPVTYNVDDSAGNPATQVTRTVNVVDTTVPVITLVGANPQAIEVNAAYAELGATAIDAYDGNISGSIIIDATLVNASVVGLYSVTYDVTDSNLNAAVQVTRTVNVVDTTLPVIALTGSNPQQVDVGSPYLELGATATDNYDGDITGSIAINSSAVNTAVLGGYTVTYDVTDANGNAAVQVTRTVDVIDAAEPVISLLGANPQTIEVGSAYVELGATAFDAGDGDVTGSIVIDSSAVNIAIVGSYAVTYDVTDSQGNPAVQVTRTVTVVDTTLPVITLAGANPQVIEVGSAYTELGAMATDNYDGDISGTIVIDSSAVNMSFVGGYPVTYNVTDANGNVAVQATRTVNVVDTTIPVITLVGADPQILEVGSPYPELGATAADNYDGDLTGSIVIDSSAVNTAVLGSYLVTYNVTDANGNAAGQLTRTVTVLDTGAPVITLVGTNPQIIEVGTPYVELGATANDSYDGDISGSIVIDSSAVNTAVVGVYAVTYDVVDSSGNPAFGIRTVNVVDTTGPVITLAGANPQTLEVGSPYLELGATALDNYDGDISGSIVIDSSSVNTSVPGTYPVTYNVSDANGNSAAQVTRTVSVVDTTSPVITLIGANPQTVDVASPYVELGANATDNYDGDITGSIVIDASAVNPAVVGSYPVTYNVTDANGNAALQVTRTINVVNVAPTLGAIADRSGPEGTMVTFTAVASDPDPTDILNYSLSGAPAGAAIDPSSGIFTWTPTEAQGPGSFAFDVVVSDAGTPALTDQQTLTISVSEVNTAPVFGVIGPQTVDEMTGLSFTTPVTDVDIPANTLTFSLAGEPAGATINPTTGAVLWTPTEAQGPGVYGFDIVVGDGGSPTMTDTQAVTVSVAEINVAPVVVNPGPQSSAEADPIVLAIAASDADLPTNTLSYSAVGLPDGLSINATTGEISGTVTYDASPGSPYTTTVTVTDNGTPARSHQATFNWVVADTNRDPVPADDNVSLPEDSTRLFTVLSNDMDPDLDSLSISAVGVPAHGLATITGPGITYAPDANYFGPDAFQYTVSDGRGGAVTAAVSVTVVPVNDAPVLNSPTSLLGNEGSPVSFTASATDIEGDAVSFSLAAAPAGAAIDGITGYFSWIPAEAQGPGTYTFDVVATDDGTPALSTSRQLEITVAEVNSAPVIANPGIQVSAEDRAVSLQIVATDSDIPAGTLRYAASGLPPGLAIDPDTGEITGTSPFDGAAAYSVTVIVTDDGIPQRSAQATFMWTVTNTNRPPSADDLVVFAEAGIPTSLVLNGSDPDGDTLIFQIATVPAHGVLTGGPRLYDYTADVAANGTDTFTFIVSDGDMQAAGTATVSITPNLVPYGGSDEYVVRQGGVLVVEAPGVLSNDRDPEREPISAVLTTAPAHGALTLNSDGSFIYDNRGASVDIDTFTYRVDDGMRLSAPISVLIIIEENLAPIVVDDSVALDEDTAIVLHPLANDHDPNNEPLVLKAVGSPEHGSVEWSLDGSIIFAPERDWNGSDTITYTATDGDLETSGSIAILVRPVNDAPVVVAAEVTGHSGDQLMIDLRPFATDVDGDNLDFILESPTDGTVRRESAGVFVIDLDGVVHDLPPLTFIASDPLGAKASSLLTIIVRIPASLVGVPSLVADDLGDPGGTDDPPPDNGTDGGAPLLTGLRLMVGSMFDTFQALRVPMFAVLLLALASLYLGLSQKFAFVSTPTALPLVGRRKVDIVMAQSGAGVPARTEPGTHQAVKFRFAPTERGLITTGARTMVRSEVWVEVETPEGDGWVNAEFLTEQMTDATFGEDDRPIELIAGLVDRIYRADDLLEMTAGHDLHVAYYGPPIRFAANSLPRLLRGASVYWWWQADGDAPRLQGTFGETVGESITGAYRNRDAHLADSAYSIPPEFVNMHSLVLGHHEYGEGWRVFFRYENDEPSIAGLMREAQPNKAAMLGEMRQKTA